jgi:hypothetical protein
MANYIRSTLIFETPSCGEIRYPYIDADGTLLYEVVRHHPKRFEVVDPFGRVVPDGTIPAYVLYRLPELLAADPADTVYFVEGEKDVETLRTLGLVATTNPGGARHGWQPCYVEHFRGRHVVILPDADGPGRRLADAVAAGLDGVATTVIRLELPGLRGGADVSDWLNMRTGRDVHSLRSLVRKARFERAGLTGRPSGRQAQTDLALATRLPTLDKLVLLALLWHSRSMGALDFARLTAAQLGRLCSCHRVTAQRTVQGLRQLGILRHCPSGGDSIEWDILAALTARRDDRARN